MKLVALVQLRQKNGLRTYGVFDKSGKLLRRETQIDCGQGAAQAREVVSRVYRISSAEWTYKLAREKAKAGLSLPEIGRIAGAKLFALSNMALTSSLAHAQGFTFTGNDWTPKDEDEIDRAFQYCASFDEDTERGLQDESDYWFKELNTRAFAHRLLPQAIDHHSVDIKLED